MVAAYPRHSQPSRPQIQVSGRGGTSISRVMALRLYAQLAEEWRKATKASDLHGGFEMIVTAWNNGKHHESGAGYGFKVDTADRDELFKREWEFVILELEGSSNPVKVNVDKPSFWGKCSELINKEIGKWLREKGLAPWPKYEPPKFSMEPISENRFLVSDLSTVSE